MDLVDILPDVIYWSEVLCCIILTHIIDLEVKVTNLKKFYVKNVWLKFFFYFSVMETT